MSDKPKRRVWQVHLSTAVIPLCVAGPLLCINVNTHMTIAPGDCTKHPMESEFVIEHQCGWPFDIYDGAEPEKLRIVCIVADALVAASFLVGSAFVIEFVARRLERRKV